MLFNILDFGAIGDGCTLNTRAFEQVCRAAAEAKDGAAVIVVPPGTYISGSIDLPSNTTLRLELGAVLKSSANPDDLKENTEIFPHRSPAPGMSYDWLPRYFIGAFHQHDVIIEGDGTIDGNGEAFWEDRCHDGDPWIPDNPNYPVCYRVLIPKALRPVTISFWKCRNVTVRGVRISNSAAYTVWPLGCDNVRIQDITVRNPLCGPNTDVLDIDCSENVIISGCDIIAGDDCIALKSDTARLGEDKPCRNIAVTNCVFTSATCGVRIGYEGDGAITDCVFSNLVINDTKNAIDILSLTPLPRPDYKTGTPIERISFSNITMRNVSYAFHVWCGTENEAQPYAAHISDLTFANITALTRNGSIIVSKDGAPIRNVFMSCVSLIRDEHPCLAKCVPCDFPDVWGGAYIPEILKLHRIENIRMDGVVLESAGTVNPLSEGAFLGWTEVKNAVRDNVRLPESGSMTG